MADLVDPFDPKPAATVNGGIVDPFAAAAPARTLAPAPAASSGDGDFVRGLKRTLPEMKQLVGGTIAAVGDVAGAEGLRDYGLDIYKAQERKLQPLTKPTDSATEAWKQVRGGNLGAGVDFLQNAAGYTTGQALESLAAAGAGAAIGAAGGTAAAPGPGSLVGGVAGTVGGFVGKQALKRTIKQQAKDLVAEQIARGVAKKEAKQAGAEYVAKNASKDALTSAVGRRFTERKLRQIGGAAIGTVAGQQAMNTTMELGSVYPTAYEQARAEGRELTAGEKTKAVGASLAAAGLESAADLFNLGVLFRGVKGAAGEAAEKGIRAAMKRYAGRAAVATTEGALREAGTEAAQTGLERFGASQSLTDAEAFRDYVDSAAVGAVGGFLFGAGAAVRPQQQGQAPAARTQPEKPPAPLGEDPGDALRADVLQAKTPREFEKAHRKLVDYLEKNGRMIAGPPTVVAPGGTATLPADQPPTRPRVGTAAPLSRRSIGLTPDVQAAQERHPGFALPDPANGPLSRTVNIAAGNGALAAEAEQQRAALAQERDAAAAQQVEQQIATEKERIKRRTEATGGLSPDAPLPPNLDMETGELQPWLPEQIKAWLIEQDAQGHAVPKPSDIAAMFSLKPRGASELRRQAMVEIQKAKASQERTDELPAGRAEPGRAPVDGGVVDGRNAGEAATRQGAADPAGAGNRGTDAGAVPGDRAAAARPAEADAGQAPAGSLTYDESTEQQEGDITPPSGNPFTIEDAARLEAERTEGGRVFPVDGGFVVRVPQGAPQTKPPGVPAPESAPSTASQAGPVQRPRTVSEESTAPPAPGSTSARPAVAGGEADAVRGTGSSPSPQDTPAGEAAPAGMEARTDRAGRTFYVPAKALEAAAHEAATSPQNGTPAPTEAQKEAGNYKMGHRRIAGLDVSIENPAGSRRRPEWPPLKNHYGYFRGTVGKDKDHVDVFLTDRAEDESLPVFVVDQNNRDGSFDEHKVILGAADEAEARATYLQNYAKGWTGLGGIREFTQEGFRAWVKDPALTKRRAAVTKSGSPVNSPGGSIIPPPASTAAESAKDRRALIDAGFAANRQAIKDKGLKKGDTVSFPGTNGRTFTGTILSLGDKEQAFISVGVEGARGVADWHVAARDVTKVEQKPADAQPAVKVDKAELRPYRRPDGSVGYEAIPIQESSTQADDRPFREESLAPAPAGAPLSTQALIERYRAMGHVVHRNERRGTVTLDGFPSISEDAARAKMERALGLNQPGEADERPATTPEMAQNAAEEIPDVRRQENRPDDRSGDVRGNQREQPAEDRNDDAAARVDAQQPAEAARAGELGGSADGAQARVPAGARGSERGEGAEQPSDADRVPASRRAPPDAVIPKTDLTITGELDFSGIGAVGKFKQNIAAIKLLKTLEAEGRRATPEEQSVLAKYVGWGGLPQAFRHPTSGKISKGWEGRVAELEDVLTADELAAAGRSTQDAHYTAANVVTAMWSAVARLGFDRGRVLEPSMGTGNFFGLMPQEQRAGSQLTGVELDSITGRIAQQLYQTANVQVRGFNEIRIAPASFDLAIGNPPFGAQSIHDPQYPEESKASIHNYFFAKSIASVRPGGLLAMVVSSSFLDANTSATRAWIAERARFVGAIRLPQTAFQANAGTNVTTDIVFLQRLPAGAKSNPDAWVRVGSMSDKGNAFPVNRYFVDNPDMMLGKMVWSTHTTIGRAGAVLEAAADTDLTQALADAVAKLPQDVYQVQGKTFAKASEKANPEPEGPDVPVSAKVYGYYTAPDGTLHQRQPDHNGERQSVTVDMPETSAARVAGMARIRDLARALLRAELDEASTDEALAKQRERLNKAYDAFVKDSGRLSRDVNKRLFRDDPDSALLLSLERDYDKGVSPAVAKKNGVASRKESARKADIFTKRTNYPVKPVTEVSDAKSAMLASLNERGRLDPDFMTGIYPGKSIEDIEAELGDEVFREPSGDLVPADAYLSGNVKAKLAAAKASDDPKMQRNIAALEAVQPVDVEPTDIFVQLGSPWIPVSDYADFARETFEGKLTGSYVHALGGWRVNIAATNRLLNNERWGHERLGAGGIMEMLMANKPVAIYDKTDDGKRVLNQTDTAAAKGKAAELQQAFADWIWNDAARRERLARFFNDTYNTDVRRKYDGSHMTFPGMNRSILAGGVLRPHQSAFAYRMVQDGVALADHVVGAGKTFASIAGIMEMRRLGLWRKPMIVVPNHLVDQWATDFVRLYPGANVLAASRKDFTKANRKRLFGRIATGDWDAVIVAHSSFGFIPLPSDAEKSILEQEVVEITDALDAMRAAGGKKDLSYKQLQKRQEAIKERIKRMAERPRDDLMDFAEMGVDALTVDEAHEFKNLYFVTTQRNVAGLGSPEGSKKAFDLFVKMRYLSERNGGKNRVFLTGTPVSNTLSEVFHMQRYLQYDELVNRKIAMFDTWASTFGQIVSDWEMDAAGRFKEKARFRKFANLPELVTIWRQVADTVTLADLRRDAEAQGRRFPVPKIATGKRQNITVPRSPEQAAYIGEAEPVLNADGTPRIDPETGIPLERYPEGSIIYRMDNMPKDPSIDNHLKATGDARKASLDYRLVEPGAPDFDGSKINVAVRNIVDIWRENAPRRGTQLVFCDLSVPASARGKATEAAQARMPTWFVNNGDGDIEHVAGVKLSLSSMPDGKFFSLKTKRDGYQVYEANSGEFIASGRAKQDAIDEANASLTKDAATWREKFEANAIPAETIDAYVQRWEDEKARREEEAAESGKEGAEEEAPAQAISMDELLADESTHSVYDDMKAKLIKAGIPEREIAFIHDYNTDLQKADLFAKVNRGEIRILFGSTAKMGAGMNVQKKLVAEHHMDAPWRPSDLIQREGRILRQGNEFYEADPDGFEVTLMAYGTEQTYDARQWEIIETKAHGIETFQAGDSSVREIEDISSEAASAADMKGAASGNPLILESIKLRKEVRDLEAQERSHKRAMHSMESLVRSVDNKTSYAYKNLRDAEALRDRYSGNEFSLTLGRKTYTDPKEVKSEPILSAFKAAIDARGPSAAGTFRGLDIMVEPRATSVRVILYDGRNSIGATEFGREDKVTPGGFVTRLENIFKRIATAVPDATAGVARIEREAEQARTEMQRGFPKAAELASKRDRQRRVVEALRAGRREVDGPDPQKFSRPMRSEASALAALKEGRGHKAMSRAEVERIARALLSRWANAPRLVVLGSDPGGNARGGEGWYDDRTGTVVLVAPNLRGGYDATLKREVSTAERIRMVTVHESIGHHGIEAITGQELWAELERTIDRMRGQKRYAAIFNEIDRRYRGANRSIATREAIAVMAEKGIRNSVIDRVIAALRRFLRDVLGLSIRFSDAELRQHIVAAARYVRGGARPRTAAAAAPAPRNLFASRPAHDLAKHVPVVNVVGGVFGDVERDLKGARKRAIAYLTRLRDSGHLLANDETGWRIGLSNSGIREMVNFDPGKISLLLALPRITKVATFGRSEPPRDGQHGVTAYHSLYAPVRVGNELRIARLIVREDVNGTFAYDFQRSDILKQPSPAEAGLVGAVPASTPAPKAGAKQEQPTALTVAQIRDLVNATGRDGWQMSRRADTFYSALAEAVTTGKGAPKRADAKAWAGWLDGAQRRGEFRQSERDWLGVDTWLAGRGQTTRQELADFVRANQVQVQDVMLGANEDDTAAIAKLEAFEARMEAKHGEFWRDDMTSAEAAEHDSLQSRSNAPAAKFGSYVLPGGEHYRELLLTLPDSDGGVDRIAALSREELGRIYEQEIGYDPTEDDPNIETDALREMVRGLPASAAEAGTTAPSVPTANFHSSHFDQPNILAHVRFNERRDTDGNRVLFLEEIQSDWHQTGRKRGYVGRSESLFDEWRAEKLGGGNIWTVFSPSGAVRGRSTAPTAEQAIQEYARAEDADRVPDAPFKGADEWAMLAFKRMVRYAAENGYDRIAWTTGAQQAERYDLSKQVNHITYFKNKGTDTYNVHIDPAGAENSIRHDGLTIEQVEGLVGKDIAQRIVDNAGTGSDGQWYSRSAYDYAGTLKGDGLKVGGEGMRAFYDKILPSAVNKWGKKFGARTEKVSLNNFQADFDFLELEDATPAELAQLETDGLTVTVQGIDLTPDMRDAAMQGQPLFSRADPAADPGALLADVEAVMAGSTSQGVLERVRSIIAEATPQKIKDQLRGTWLGALTARHLTDLGSDYFGNIQHYSHFLAKMVADLNMLQAEAEHVAEPARKWAAKHRAEAKRLFDLMHEATIEGVDAAKDFQPLQFRYGGVLHDATPKNVKAALKAIRQQMRERSGDSKKDMMAEARAIRGMPAADKRRKAKHPGLAARFAALSPEAQDIYVQFRDMYAKRSDQVEAALIDRINDTDAADNHKRKLVNVIRQQFETARLQGVYFPLQRHGRYFVAAERDGTSTFMMFERLSQLERAVKDLRGRGFTITAQGEKQEGKAKDAPSGTFVAEVIAQLKKSGVSEVTQDEIYQIYLQALPELSMRKHAIHRKAVPGFDPDAVRGFAFNMHHGAHQLARLRYAHKLQDVLTLLQTQQDSARREENADTRKIAAGDAILGELARRHRWIMDPQDSQLTNLVSSFGFVYYLGVTPAAALVNLTQTPMVTYPYLAARFGAGKAMNVLMAAMRDSARTAGHIEKTLTSREELDAHAALEAMGAFDKTLAHNLAGIAEGGLQGYNPKWAKAMEIIGWGFHKAEVINRESTGIATFRLARASGMSYQASVDAAAEAIIETHFDYTNANRARFMQSGPAKVLLMFRQFSLNMTWHLGRMVWKATKGETPEVKRLARRNLAGVLGMTGLFAGTLGLPLTSVIFGVLNAIASSFGDDDDPWDAETEFRAFLADMMGADTAELLLRGPVNALTGANVASRVSLSDLWFRDADRELDGRGRYYNLLEQAAGPMGGVLKNALVGKQLMDEGHLWRGVETVLPKSLKDMLKSARYATEGVNSLRGDPLLEDVGVYRAALQLAGFTPAEVARQYDLNRSLKNYEQHILKRRERLLDSFAMALRTGDGEARQKVLQQIHAFNRTNPELAITTKTMRASIKSRARYSEQAEAGIVLNKKIAARVRERVGLDQ